MKKIYTFLILMVAFVAASAQSVDYEIAGFADSDGHPISSIVLNSSQDLQPRVILQNNGPDAVATTDTILFYITYNDAYEVTTMVLTGTQLHSVIAGEQAIVDLPAPLWTAAVMNEYGLTACSICYEVRIIGRSIDPVYTNNKACIDVTREVGIAGTDPVSVSLFPNPAAATVTLTGAENARVQLFDLSGRLLSVVESASENQQIDVSNWAEGLYIVRISDGKNSIAKKLNVIR